MIKKNISVNEFEKIIYAGVHLKRLGDYAQVNIFNESELTYFQTVDEYCLLYAMLIIKPYKVVILSNKSLYVQIILNGVLYDLIICNNGNKFDYINERLLNIIERIEHHEGGFMIDSEKIENNSLNVNNLFINHDKYKIMTNRDGY